MEEDVSHRRPRPFLIKVIASPEDYKSLSIQEGFSSTTQCEVVGAFNAPLTTLETENGLEYLLMPRVAEIPTITLEQGLMYVPEKARYLPYFEISNKKIKTIEMKFDRVPEEDILDEGKKDVKLRGHNRLKHISLPRILRLNENLDIIEREQKPAIYPEWEHERFGLEDVRITKFNNEIYNEIGYKYALTYVTPHRTHRVSTSIALTNDFKKFKKLPFGDTPRRVFTGKDIAIFPRKCLTPHMPLRSKDSMKKEKNYVGITRPEEHPSIAAPGLGLAYSPDLTAWWSSHDLNGFSLDGKTRGTGSPPIKIGNLWVIAFHEVTSKGSSFKYDTRLMGLDIKNPWKIKYISDIFLTREDFSEIIPERGYVEDVVYTTGFVEKDGMSLMSHGVGDFKTVLTQHYTEDILKFLKGKRYYTPTKNSP